MKRIYITTGDQKGIGLEITVKALNLLGPQQNIQFVLWRSHKDTEDIVQTIKKPFKRFTLKNISQVKTTVHRKETHLLDLSSPLCPTDWVVHSTKACLLSPDQALVTGPLSKIQMQKDGFTEKGHTELLKKLSGEKHLFMIFLGKFFNVALLTGHTPLKKVIWTKTRLQKCISLCLNFQKKYLKHKNKKIALLGFNPHAGENGLLGKEEIVLRNQLKLWKNQITEPLVPDVAFLKSNWKNFSIYICLYHDQGLIPFKMIHGRQSFQYSLGLPFIRTSVSHGTASDIFKQNKADPSSMKQALLGAIKFLHTRKNKTHEME